MGYGAHLIRPGSTAIDPLTEPALMTPLRRSTRSLLPWRPVGYVSITVVWFLIFAVAVFGLIVAPIGIRQSSLAGASLSESTAFEGEDGAIGILIMVVIVPPLLGTATIVSASTGFVLANATLFARSLRADYRDGQLSFTVQSSSGDTMGPQGGTSVAMSLLPTWLTRWAKITLMIEFFGFVVNRNSVIVGTAWGYFYVFTVAWLFWPVSGAALWVCIAVSALLLALVAVAVWWRRSHIATVMPKSFRKSVYEYSWPNTAPERG